MKTLRILIFALLATVTVARGQTFSIAETNTPEIQALARGLQNDPLRIFDYVHDHIKYVFYYGSKKGAQLTLSEGSGNDFDQCALLVALLNAAGYANTSYKYETVDIPYDATDGTHNDLHHWLQLSLVNTNWANTTGYFNYLTATQQRNFPYVTYLTGDTNTIVLPHVWVLLTIGSTTYNLDPSFKVSEPVAGINLTAALGYGNVANLSNALMNAAGGTVTTNYVQSLSESSLRSALQNCNSNLLAVLQNNYETSSVLQILGGQQIIPWTNGLSLSQTFAPYYDQIDYPPQTWTYLPTNYMATFGIAFCGVTNSWYFPALQGRRLSLTFNSTGLGQLWLDDSLIFQTNTGPYIDANKKVSVGFICTFPPNYGNNFAKWAEYDPTNSSYAILYAFEPEPKRLHERQQILDTYIQEGFTNNSRQVLTETLNVMGLNWMTQTKLLGDDILGQQMGMSPEWEVRLGRAAEESGNGYYIDAYCQLDREEPNSGITAADQQRYAQYFDLKNYFGSAMEHSIIEQLQSSNLVGASTVKILQLANTNKNAIYLANITNWSAVSSQLTGYASAAQSAISAAIANGDYLLLPANGSVAIAGTGSWAGAGYVDLSPSLTSRSISMLLGGGYNGGFSAFPSSAIDSSYVQSFNFSQPFYLNLVPPSVTVAVGADPVSMADAAFKVATPDLSIGQAEPMGITFTRYYSPTYRHLNLANMGYGWVNSYYMNLATVSAPETSLGGNTPAQMAPILTAAWAAANLYNTTPSAKNWLVTALIAKWGIDQTINNAVSVTLGNNVLQFIKQPDGSFTPPANCNWSLTNKPTYILQERHGNTFTFNATKQLTGITNQYGVGLALTYSGTNVSTVTDWKGRAFTFTYSGSPARLTQVADATGRSVKYGYATNVDQKLDLVLVTDPEGKTNSFQYDTNHQIVATVDALGRLVVSNVYDSFGHVTTQYTQGDPNKTWQIYWSGW